MIGKEALRGGPGHEAGLRRALLQRIVNRLGIAELYATDFTPRELAECCWVSYDRECPHPDGTSHIEHWVYALCDEDCPHWHHQTEVWMA
jgi:hypothetical protein